MQSRMELAFHRGGANSLHNVSNKMYLEIIPKNYDDQLSNFNGSKEMSFLFSLLHYFDNHKL